MQCRGSGGRDPTTVELFDIAQSNSEHSRHWFFKADIKIDGVSQPESLFDLVKVAPQTRPSTSLWYSVMHHYRVGRLNLSTCGCERLPGTPPQDLHC